ncbi:MAG: acetoacetate--CoA ligase [Saprospiraceae bacterium]|nr:acetoacetate--CoA ligase [Saprospiraceae bacterium]
MDSSQEILWRPSAKDIQNSRLTEYRRWLDQHLQLAFPDYESLWQWSVDKPEIFWETIVSFFNVKMHSPYSSVMSGGPMPDTVWFEGATLNYAEHIFLGMKDQSTALLFASEAGHERSISVDEMWREVAKLRAYFQRHGVKEGDRIAGYLPNIPEATYAFIATVSLGAIWSCCSQDFGVSSVVDRFAQIKPVLFIAADGYYYNGKTHVRLAEIDSIRHALPELKNSLVINYVGSALTHADPAISLYHQLVDAETTVPVFEPVPFNHPLWILYSSGTTGAPKAITHSHGGCLLEHLKYLAFHNDVHRGEKFFWYTTTGWMMWNFLQGSMLHGATVVLYDGSPGYTDLDRLWKLSEQWSIQHFGTSAPYLVACMKEGLEPGKKYNLSGLRSIGSTGSPLPPEAFQWVYKEIHSRIWLCSMSGGTDVCTAFVGGVIEKDVVKGEIQARGLGCALYAYNEKNETVTEEVGEMVITKPMPSMPIYFWNDTEKKKYRSSYFEDIPGVWRHGDWVKITKQGGVIIYGRSDATLNRQGIRIGTAEIYRVLNEIPEIEDGLIVNLELEGGRHYMPLFLKLKGNTILDEAIIRAIATALRTKCSPRHVPDDIFQVDDIPYTISGKKMEAPVKKILMGMEIDSTLNRDAMRNPESLLFFKSFIVPEEKG